jgi:hypothetical protein
VIRTASKASAVFPCRVGWSYSGSEGPPSAWPTSLGKAAPFAFNPARLIPAARTAACLAQSTTRPAAGLVPALGLRRVRWQIRTLPPLLAVLAPPQ